jgi:hypothetical protein
MASKRDLENRLDELEDGRNPGGYPEIDDLARLLAYDWEPVEGHDNLRRREGTEQVFFFDPEKITEFRRIFSEDD